MSTIDNKRNSEPYEWLDNLFSLRYLFDHLSNIDKFKKWITEYHKEQDIKTIYPGFHYFIRNIIRNILDEILKLEIPHLEEDITLYWAEKRKPDNFFEVPNSCNKTIFLKNALLLENELRNVKEIDKIDEAKQKIKPLIIFIDFLIKNSKPNFDVPKDNLLKLNAIIYIHSYCEQVLGSKPLFTSNHNLLEIDKNDFYYAKILKGYIYSLQFLWYSILGKEIFESNSVKDMHKYIDEDLESKNFKSKDFFAYWKGIDNKFYWTNYRELVAPLLSKYSLKVTDYKTFRTYVSEFDENTKTEINILFNVSNIPKSEFREKTDYKSMEKQIEEQLYWLPFETLGLSGQSGFYGIAGFIPLMKGAIIDKEDRKNEKDVIVKVFRHPRPIHSGIGYTYSFAILFENRFHYTAPGWFIFHDCATDFSGFGSQLLDNVMKEIIAQHKKGKIILKEFTIDNPTFFKFLKLNSLSIYALKTLDKLYSEENVLLKLREIQDILQHIKARLLEKLTYKWLLLSNKYDKVLNNIEIKLDSEKAEFDNLTFECKEIINFECKLRFNRNELSDILVDFKKKTSILKTKYKDKQVKHKLVFYYRITERNIIRQLKKNKIDYIFIEDEIRHLPEFKEDRKSLPYLMNYVSELLKKKDQDIIFENVDEA